MAKRHTKEELLRMPLSRRWRLDAVMLAIYFTAVYVWGLGTFPMGRDFAAMAGAPGAIENRLIQSVFDLEVWVFGAFSPGYQFGNLALLYACALCLYFAVNLVIGRPYWLGALAASFFLAAPYHTESALNLSGVRDLLPCLAALSALTSYLLHSNGPRRSRLGLALALYAGAVWIFPENVVLFGVFVLYEWLGAAIHRRHYPRLVGFAVITAAAVYLNGVPTIAGGLSFLPMLLLVYPFGILPETSLELAQSAWMSVGAAALTVFCLLLVVVKSGKRVVLFGVLTAFVVYILEVKSFIEPYHMVGGGQLLLPGAMAYMGLCIVFRQMMEHRRWRAPLVLGTTVMALIMFGLQIHANLTWKQMGRDVQRFVEEAGALSSDERVGIFPDFGLISGAPVRLSEAVRYTTPFGPALPHVAPLVTMDYTGRGDLGVWRESYSEDSAALSISGVGPMEFLPWPYRAEPWFSGVTLGWGEARLEAREDGGFNLKITADLEELPPRVITPALFGGIVSAGG